jgi:hypothetical protein
MFPKAEIVLYLGPADNYKDSFICYDPKTRGTKVRHDVKWFQANQTNNTHQALKTEKRTNVPNTLNEALTGPDKEKWIEAIRKELTQCFDRGTFKRADKSKYRNITPMKSKIVLDIKEDGTYKARWVACGYSQVYGRDYDETFSPTASFKAILTVLHVAAVNNQIIFVVDIGNAFLESNLDQILIMSLPKELVEIMNWEEEPLEIQRGLYGLKQAGKLWFDLLKRILIEYGFKQSIFEPCTFVHQARCLRICTHVDDLLITADTEEEMNKLIIYLETKLQKVKTQKHPPYTYLGMRITRDPRGKVITLDQSSYIGNILSEMPAIAESNFPLEAIDLSINAEEGTLDPINNIVGKLRYLADRTRPDLSYPVNYMCRFMTTPNANVYIELYRLLGYIKKTSDLTMHLGGAEIQLFAMSDSSFRHEDGARAQHGYSIFLGVGSAAVSISSKRSTTVALSTTQAEADATVEAIKEVLWFQGFLQSINIPINKPTLVLVDNNPVVTLANGGNNLKRSKHFIIKTAYIKDQHDIGNIKVVHVQGILNHSDILTKPLKGYPLEYHTKAILGIPLIMEEQLLEEIMAIPQDI